MITIDQCRISNDGKRLFIEAHVKSEEYLYEVYIDSVDVDTQDTVLVNRDRPSESAVNVYRAAVNTKSISITVDTNAFLSLSTFSKDILYVYVKAKGTPGPATPCDQSNTHTLAVVFDLAPIYNSAMQYTKELADSCSIPSGFIDLILNLEALKVSISTGHYPEAEKIFKRLQDTGPETVTVRKCGCHG